MTKFLSIFALTVSVPALALAQATADLDTNADGVLTLDEVQAGYPDISVDMFTTMDLNADGALDGEEIAAAQEAGILPPSQG
ncbi:MAG: hypothetical protein AAGL96_14375 [Pseudomonadota bacterium]